MFVGCDQRVVITDFRGVEKHVVSVDMLSACDFHPSDVSVRFGSDNGDLYYFHL